ncbi:MAG: hypothetical protein L3J95_05835 [Thermoplasmata archaeon]|nr:hypothetical protein [Thermoplasmata archaeon]MCI4359917.1 hypothetical protein [Thermoplasmata archaeon]
MSSAPSLPSGVAFAPPPPGPWYGVPPGGPPPPGYPIYPAWVPAPQSPPGDRTRRAVEALKNSIDWYLTYLALTVLTALAAAALLSEATFSSAGPLSGAFRSVGRQGPTYSLGYLLAVGALVGLIEVVGIIVLVVAWVKWRTGADRLSSSAGEFGVAAGEAARGAVRSWTYATVLYILGIVATLIVALALVAASISSVLGQGATNRSMAISQAVTASLAEIVVVVGVVSFVFTFLTYWFATGGLVAGLVPIAPGALREKAQGARIVILLGAALTVLGVAGLLVPFGGLLGVVSPLVILYGFWKLRGAYQSWLSAPPQPGIVAPA